MTEFNPGPLASEATTPPTQPQRLPKTSQFFLKKRWANPCLFLFILVLFSFIKIIVSISTTQIEKSVDGVCMGFEPGATGWQAQTKPWSYGGHPTLLFSTYAAMTAKHYAGYHIALKYTLSKWHCFYKFGHKSCLQSWGVYKIVHSCLQLPRIFTIEFSQQPISLIPKASINSKSFRHYHHHHEHHQPVSVQSSK